MRITKPRGPTLDGKKKTFLNVSFQLFPIKSVHSVLIKGTVPNFIKYSQELQEWFN